MTAIELHAAMAKVPRVLTPLGRCVGLEMDYDDDLNGVGSSSSEDEGDNKRMYGALRKFSEFAEMSLNTVAKPFAKCHIHSGNVVVNTGAFKWDWKEARRNCWKQVGVAKLLFDNAPAVGVYGDAVTLETKVDESVRKARDYYFDDPSRPGTGHFTCDEELLEEVARKWCDNMYPGRDAVDAIWVVPYKINCYGPDGMFAEHKDTPDVNLIGSVVLGLVQEGEDVKNTPHLIAWAGKELFSMRDTEINSACCFFTDVTHKVQATGNYRATLSFKVFLDKPEHARERLPELLLAEARKALPADRAVGFLLSHKYSHSSSALKGHDAMFHTVLEQCGLYKSIEVVPVLMTVEGVVGDGGYQVTGVVSTVYRITDDDLLRCFHAPKPDWMRRSKKERLKGSEEIPFFVVAPGYTWDYRHVEGAEHTGNESRAEDLQSVYIHKAVIARQ
jgi:hypothetical protein